MTTIETYYVRDAIVENDHYSCPCCGKRYDYEAYALNCCQHEGMVHIAQEKDDTETICGIPVDHDLPVIAEIDGYYVREDFDPSGYCHFCLEEDHNQ